MIFLNAEKFIQEAIQSVFAQTYEHWELLLVDDGSSDRSTAVAQQYAQQYPQQVRYLEHERHQNRGMSASRNLGISHTRGAYIAFLDSDDAWLPHKLEVQVASLEAQPEAGMVYGPTQYWYSWTGQPADLDRDFIGELGVPPNTLVKPPMLLTLSLQNNGASMPGICSILVRRETIACVGGFEEAFRGPYEDQVFLTKVYLKTPAFVMDKCLDMYRQHPDSCCAVAIEKGEYHPELPHSARGAFLHWLAGYVATEVGTDTELWQVLQRALKPYRYLTLYRLLGRVQLLMRRLKNRLMPIARRTWALPLYCWLRAQWYGYEYHPPVGWVRFGSLRRLMPIGLDYGYYRGLPIDRYYIEKFLTCHAEDIRGRVLEVGEAAYTRRFGGDRVTIADVLHVVEGNPKASIVGDLTHSDHIPSDTFDCFVLTQTLHLIYDVLTALQTAYRILKPGGVLLATFPGISQISTDEWGESWYWSFTTLSAQCLFEEVFPAANIQVETHGNVLTAISFLQGLAAGELRQEELDCRDRAYDLLITVRAVKPDAGFYERMIDRWQYQSGQQFAYGEDTTYKKGMAFLDGHGEVIEDWGCGTAYAKNFVKKSTYIGIDGSQTGFVDKIVDLRGYTSNADCILMRHVLEHNIYWRDILKNAISSFKKRMVLIIFTPFSDKTRQIGNWSGIPSIAFKKQELTKNFQQLRYTEEQLQTNTEYKIEHIFYIEKL
jgi:glycosyltransferase involved in cell wall biosynthesis